MRYLFAAGILATAEFAVPYPIQCCAGCPARPNLIMRVFSRKHACTRASQTRCLSLGAQGRGTFGIGGEPCVEARKHDCVKTRKHETVLSRLRAVGEESFCVAHERTRKRAVVLTCSRACLL